MRKEREVTRRALLGGALAAGTMIVAFGQPGGDMRRAFALNPPSSEDGSGSIPDESQYGFLVRTDKCIDCGECVDACRLWSRTPDSAEARRSVVTYKDAIGRERYLSIGCMHCKNPSCMAVCPAGAIEKGAGGVVTVDKSRCIGCKYCYQACPFGIPNYTSKGMDKCDYCLAADVPLGEKPHCVEACKVDALKYGKLEDLLAWSSATELIGGPTEPSYVLL